jgi:hypothetical protein
MRSTESGLTRAVDRQVLFGTVTNTFRDFFLGSVTRPVFDNKLSSVVLYYVYLSVVVFVSRITQACSSQCPINNSNLFPLLYVLGLVLRADRWLSLHG